MPHQSHLEGGRGERTPQCCRLQQLPGPTAPNRGRPHHAAPNLNHPLKESSREGQNPPCCRLQLEPHPTMPGPTAPRLTLLCRAPTTLQREQQRKPKPPVLPSATVTTPGLSLPRQAIPKNAAPRLNYSPKRAAERACALSAAVCNCYPA